MRLDTRLFLAWPELNPAHHAAASRSGWMVHGSQLRPQKIEQADKDHTYP